MPPRSLSLCGTSRCRAMRAWAQWPCNIGLRRNVAGSTYLSSAELEAELQAAVAGGTQNSVPGMFAGSEGQVGASEEEFVPMQTTPDMNRNAVRQGRQACLRCKKRLEGTEVLGQ